MSMTTEYWQSWKTVQKYPGIIIGVELRFPLFNCMPETHNTPRSVADIIEAYGRMMKAKELAPLLGLDPKTLYAKSAIPGATRMAGSVRWDCYIVAEWLRQKAKTLPGT